MSSNGNSTRRAWWRDWEARFPAPHTREFWSGLLLVPVLAAALAWPGANLFTVGLAFAWAGPGTVKPAAFVLSALTVPLSLWLVLRLLSCRLAPLPFVMLAAIFAVAGGLTGWPGAAVLAAVLFLLILRRVPWSQQPWGACLFWIVVLQFAVLASYLLNVRYSLGGGAQDGGREMAGTLAATRVRGATLTAAVAYYLLARLGAIQPTLASDSTPAQRRASSLPSA